MYAKKEKTYPAYVSKYNTNCERKFTHLLIPNGEGWHYLTVKRLPILLRGITSKHHSDFYCLNCLHSFVTESKRESYKKVCQKQDFWNVLMPSEYTKISEFIQYQKSDKALFIIHADFKCLIETIDELKIILKIHSQQKQANIFCQVSSDSIIFHCLQYHGLKA